MDEIYHTVVNKTTLACVMSIFFYYDAVSRLVKNILPCTISMTIFR